jgi:cytochrome c oxidase assembly protein subunit 15
LPPSTKRCSDATSLGDRSRRYPADVVAVASPAATVPPRWFRRVTLVALVFLAAIIVTGAAVRLTGSGLGCTDWPACTSEQFHAPLEFNPMVEFVNRLISGLVAVPVLIAAVSSVVLKPRRRDLMVPAGVLLVGVGASALLGAVVVKQHLSPPFVIAHFLLAMVCVWAALVLYRRAGRPAGRPVPIVSARIVGLGRAMVLLSILVLVTGTIVTGAGPHGGDENASRIAVDIGEVARVHSVTAIAFLLLTLLTLWFAHRDGVPAQVDQHGRTLVGVILVQGAIGYAQYFTGVPAYLVAFHIVGAVAVFLAALWFHLGLFATPETRPPDVAAAPVPAPA